jgi:RimJ/RimL family protein N-acetyltransferase
VKIQNSTPSDIEAIALLYKHATALQNTKAAVPWPTFERSLIEREVEEKNQWKITIDGQIACVWATTFKDPLIWKERDQDPSVYLHRITTDPNFRGNNYVKEILFWAINYATSINKKFIRMDTVGENIGLINHYQKCGFSFLGLSKLVETNGLPLHYHNATVSLFEFELKS